MEERRLSDTIPDALIAKMRRFGSDISAARRARNWTQGDLAERLNVSRKVISAMEQGSPSVSFGAYAASAWIMGLENGLLGAFDPEHDPAFQKKARLDQPKRVRPGRGADLGSLDF